MTLSSPSHVEIRKCWAWACWFMPREGSGNGLVVAGAGHIEYLYVRPEWWHQGVGTALLDRLTAEASVRDYSRLDLDVNADKPGGAGLV